MSEPLLWNVLVAILFEKYDTADAAYKHNEMLHGLVQEPAEDMTTYVARALDIADGQHVECQRTTHTHRQGFTSK